MEQYQLEAAECYMKVMRMSKQAAHRFFLAEGVHPGQAMALHVVSCAEETPPTQKEIARELQVSAPTIASCIRRLEESGCIVRAADEEDGRCNRILLTEQGKMLSARCNRGVETIMETMMEGFSAEESRQLKGYLERMAENISRLNGPEEEE